MISISSSRRGGMRGIVRVSKTVSSDPVTMSRYPLVFGRTGDPIKRTSNVTKSNDDQSGGVERPGISGSNKSTRWVSSGNSLPKSPNMNGPGVLTTVGWKCRASNLRPRDPIGLLAVLITETGVLAGTTGVIIVCSL